MPISPPSGRSSPRPGVNGFLGSSEEGKAPGQQELSWQQADSHGEKARTDMANIPANTRHVSL